MATDQQSDTNTTAANNAAATRKAMLDHAISIGAPQSIIDEARTALNKAQQAQKEHAANKLPLLKKKQSIASSHVHQHEVSTAQLASISAKKIELVNERDAITVNFKMAQSNAPMMYDMAIKAAAETHDQDIENNRIASENIVQEIQDAKTKLTKLDKAYASTQAWLDAAIAGTKPVSTHGPTPSGNVATQIMLSNWITNVEKCRRWQTKAASTSTS